VDVFSDALTALRTGIPVSTRTQARAPWSLRFPPIAGAGFHAVLEGRPLLVTPESGPVRLAAGDVVFELAPLRANAVRPGPVRTPLWDGTVPDPQAVFDDFSTRIPAAHIGDPAEVAAAYTYLMTNQFTTGSVLTVDGGSVLV
jgi:hypothetical protein